MTLVGAGVPIHVPAYAVRVRDVSGAGDTVVAVLSAMLAMAADFESAMRAANAAAAVVVGKRGTATVTVAELRSRVLPAATLASEEKIVFDWAMLDEHLADWRRQGLRVGFTNGCFDLLHPGHVRLLAGARAACDRLVVGLNSDASVTRLKGPGRPVQPAQPRAEVLAALEAVDLVVVFEEDTPLALIERVKPTVLVKAAITRARPSSATRSSRRSAGRWCWSTWCRAIRPRRWSNARAMAGASGRGRGECGRLTTRRRGVLVRPVELFEKSSERLVGLRRAMIRRDAQPGVRDPAALDEKSIVAGRLADRVRPKTCQPDPAKQIVLHESGGRQFDQAEFLRGLEKLAWPGG